MNISYEYHEIRADMYMLKLFFRRTVSIPVSDYSFGKQFPNTVQRTDQSTDSENGSKHRFRGQLKAHIQRTAQNTYSKSSWPADMGTCIPEVTPTGLACMPHVGHVPDNQNPEVNCPIWLAVFMGAWIPEVTPIGLACMPHVGHIPNN